MELRNRALHADVSRGFGEVSAMDVRTSEFLSAVSNSVPVNVTRVNVTRVNVTGGNSFMQEYCRTSVLAYHPPERLYFLPSNAHRVAQNRFVLRFVNTSKNSADDLTKALPRAA